MFIFSYLKNEIFLKWFERFTNDFADGGARMPRNRKNLAQLVEELQNCHENSELEFKEAQKQLPKTFWPTYSSFANTSGGTVVFGIHEGKSLSIVGVDDPHKLILICVIRQITVKKSIIICWTIKTSRFMRLTGNPLWRFISRNCLKRKSLFTWTIIQNMHTFERMREIIC